MKGQVWVKKLFHENNICFGTWNMCIFIKKSMEILDVMVTRKINFACLQETKWMSEKTKNLDNFDFKL